MSPSSGKLGGGDALPPSQRSTYGNDPRHVATANQLCLGKALDLAWKIKSLLGRDLQMDLSEKVRNRELGLLNFSQRLWLIERCQGNEYP